VLREHRVVLAFPLTYMNESGQAVRALMKRHGSSSPSA
jgi:peptidyl-tRNA hydrolase